MNAAQVWELFANLEGHLLSLHDTYGLWVYAIMFFVLFAETGFIVTTALPSDTVLFAAGALVARGADFNLWVTLGLMTLAAFLGDLLNFWCGRYLGSLFFATRKIPFVSAEALAKAHDYYERHGGVAIVAARFVPVLRALAPLVGGIVRMPVAEFVKYNAIGKLLWTPLYLFGGYFFGQIPWVQKNFGVAIFFALGAPLLGIIARTAYVSVAKGR